MDAFAAVADPTRRKILDLLTSGAHTAGDLVAHFPRLSQPGVSRHLKVLRSAHLVDVTVHAQQRIYELRPEGLADLYEWVAKYQALWPETLDALERYLDAKAAGQKSRERKR